MEHRRDVCMESRSQDAGQGLGLVHGDSGVRAGPEVASQTHSQQPRARGSRFLHHTCSLLPSFNKDTLKGSVGNRAAGWGLGGRFTNVKINKMLHGALRVILK